MKIEVANLEVKDLKKGKRKLRARVSPPEFQKQEKEALRALGRELELPGFRKGKAPPEMVRKKVGERKILAETARKTIEAVYRQVIEERDFEPLSRPEVEILKLARGNPFEFKVVFTILPRLNLPDYEKIAQGIEKKEEEVTEEEIGETLDYLQKSRPRLREVERGAEEGDFLEIEFFSPELEKGKKFEDSFLLGEGRLIPGFEQELTGLKAGEDKAFELTLPDDFRLQEKAGQEARFRVKVKGVKQREEREINDEFARALGDFEDLEELKQSIKEGLGEEKEKAEKKRRREKVLQKVVDEIDFEAPPVLVEREKEKRLESLRRRAEKRFGSFEEYLQEKDQTREELEDKLERDAEKEARRFLVLREVAEKEGIEVSEQEVKRESQKVISRYPDPAKAREAIDLDQLKSYTEEKIRNEKALKALAGE